MHEYPITQEIIALACRHAASHRADRVLAIHIVIGENAGVLADSIALYFDIIARDTLCAGAALSFDHIAPQLKCSCCGALFVRRPFRFDCPVENCGGEGLPTDIGREFYIKSIEIENNDTIEDTFES